MTRRIETESGAVYEAEGTRIRRLEGTSNNTKRADGEWIELLSPLPKTSTVGTRLVLVVEPLSRYGPDDHGTDGSPSPTTRITTPVVTDSDWGTP